MSSSEDSTEFIHQTNLYYGIFYPSKLGPSIVDACKTIPKFASLITNDGLTLPSGEIFTSDNNDTIDYSITFIAADNMSISGPEEEFPVDTYCNIDPAELIKSETTNAAMKQDLAELHAELLKNLKGKRSITKQLYLGWRAVSCTWIVNDESKESSEEPPKEVSTLSVDKKLKISRSRSSKSDGKTAGKQKSPKTPAAVVALNETQVSSQLIVKAKRGKAKK